MTKASDLEKNPAQFINWQSPHGDGWLKMIKKLIRACFAE